MGPRDVVCPFRGGVLGHDKEQSTNARYDVCELGNIILREGSWSQGVCCLSPRTRNVQDRKIHRLGEKRVGRRWLLMDMGLLLGEDSALERAGRTKCCRVIRCKTVNVMICELYLNTPIILKNHR